MFHSVIRLLFLHCFLKERKFTANVFDSLDLLANKLMLTVPAWVCFIAHGWNSPEPRNIKPIIPTI